MHHQLTTKKTTAQVEAVSVPNEGEYAWKTSKVYADDHFNSGDTFELVASDGGVFIGEIEDVEPNLGTVHLKVT